MRIENEKISVKERTRTFNRMASKVDVADPNISDGVGGSAEQSPTDGEFKQPLSASNTARKASSSSSAGGRKSSSSSSAVKRRNSRATSVGGDGRQQRASSLAKENNSSSNNNNDSSKSDDSSSICTIDQNSKTWLIRSARGDYHALTKMLREDPRLSKHRDFTSGYTALHWAAKHGSLDTVKLLAGSYHVDVNTKSHGGYTPLHLACQFGHQEVFDLLVKAYGADPRIRDNHGKTPRQYMITASNEQAGGLTISSDTFRQLKDRRRSRRQVTSQRSMYKCSIYCLKNE